MRILLMDVGRVRVIRAARILDSVTPSAGNVCAAKE
jgi:hypothetical protein